MSRFLFCLIALFLYSSCSSVRPAGSFSVSKEPALPDYSDMYYWAAHPDKKDKADRTPEKHLVNNQQKAKVDVFFLHPTTYTGSRGQDQWNAPVNDRKLNKKTDKTAILHQASIFNGSGRVYAPRYRQAHLHAYFTSKKDAADKAFDLAYRDVKAAFEYYLENNNNGRPVIIASHSQGTAHAGRILKEFFDGKPMQKQLVAAYLVGLPVPADYFEYIKACETPEQTGCFCSWRIWNYERIHRRVAEHFS